MKLPRDVSGPELVKALRKLGYEDAFNYSNCFWFVLALSITLFAVTGCNTSKPKPDPLAGFHFSSLNNPTKAITEDYEDYIQKLSPEEIRSVGPVHYFEDGAGRHAVMITIGIYNEVWRHILIYDKDDKRIKTVKYVSGDYHS